MAKVRQLVNLIWSKWLTSTSVFHISAMKIHISSETEAALKSFPGFEVEPRGLIDIKVTEQFNLSSS